MELLSLKIEVHEACVLLVQDKIDGLHQILQGFQAAANQETKSTAGDKYETARAMMHLEKEKVALQLDQFQKQQQVLKQLKPQREHDQVELGSFVKMNLGLFYMSVSLGLLTIPQQVYCISPVAPLGKALLGKRAGDSLPFNGKNYLIESVS